MGVIRIKPCPFCSCSDIEKIRMQEIAGSLAVTCLNCGCIGPIADADDGAVAKWNSRDVIILPQEVIEKLMEEEEDGGED